MPRCRRDLQRDTRVTQSTSNSEVSRTKKLKVFNTNKHQQQQRQPLLSSLTSPTNTNKEKQLSTHLLVKAIS
jgi:hypothetical protein